MSSADFTPRVALVTGGSGGIDRAVVDRLTAVESLTLVLARELRGKFVEATNDGDTERFVAAFTDDAYLDDRGREFRGRDGLVAELRIS